MNKYKIILKNIQFSGYYHKALFNPDGTMQKNSDGKLIIETKTGVCPLCGNTAKEGHKEGCEIARILQ